MTNDQMIILLSILGILGLLAGYFVTTRLFGESR